MEHKVSFEVKTQMDIKKNKIFKLKCKHILIYIYFNILIRNKYTFFK